MLWAKQCFGKWGLGRHKWSLVKWLAEAAAGVTYFSLYVFMFGRKKACKQLTVYQESGLGMRSGQGFWKSSGLKI